MWETAIFYFNNFPELEPQLNDWEQFHPHVVERRNYRHEASDNPEFVNKWMFDFRQVNP
jgi:hypothetical protein